MKLLNILQFTGQSPNLEEEGEGGEEEGGEEEEEREEEELYECKC